MQNAEGVPFHGEFTSADASSPANEAAARMSLYGAGSATALTLDSNDQVVVTDLDIVVGATGLTVTVWDGSDATASAGERIMLGTFAANGGISAHYATPYFCQKGTYPKVETSVAGQVDVQIRGTIIRRGS